MKKFAVCFVFFLISSFLFCNEKNATSVENVESIKNIEASASNEANTKKSLFGETFYKPANFSSFINQFDFKTLAKEVINSLFEYIVNRT